MRTRRCGWKNCDRDSVGHVTVASPIEAEEQVVQRVMLTLCGDHLAQVRDMVWKVTAGEKFLWAGGEVVNKLREAGK